MNSPDCIPRYAALLAKRQHSARSIEGGRRRHAAAMADCEPALDLGNPRRRFARPVCVVGMPVCSRSASAAPGAGQRGGLLRRLIMTRNPPCCAPLSTPAAARSVAALRGSTRLPAASPRFIATFPRLCTILAVDRWSPNSRNRSPDCWNTPASSRRGGRGDAHVTQCHRGAQRSPIALLMAGSPRTARTLSLGHHAPTSSWRSG
jgi:hypothetical protein